jgi:hypothetical protein
MHTERPFSPELREQTPAAVQDYISALEARVLPDVRPSSPPLSCDLEARRHLYAEELRAVSNLRSAALLPLPDRGNFPQKRSPSPRQSRIKQLCAPFDSRALCKR